MIARRSKTAKSRDAFYNSQKDLLWVRARGKCESCLEFVSALEPDHVFGRTGSGAGLGWPYCDMVECLAAICRNCHHIKTDNLDNGDISNRLKQQSLARLCYRFGFRGIDTETTLNGKVRELFRTIEQEGVTKDQIIEGVR